MRPATAVFISAQWSYSSYTSLLYPLEETWYEWRTCCVKWKV